jgi:hypothetical protein
LEGESSSVLTSGGSGLVQVEGFSEQLDVDGSSLAETGDCVTL